VFRCFHAESGTLNLSALFQLHSTGFHWRSADYRESAKYRSQKLALSCWESDTRAGNNKPLKCSAIHPVAGPVYMSLS
jgi:hypothetical protein